MMALQKRYANYHLYLTGERQDDSALYAKAEVGGLIVKQSTPSAVFAFGSHNMTNAMVAYLENERRKADLAKDLSGLISML